MKIVSGKKGAEETEIALDEVLSRVLDIGVDPKDKEITIHFKDGTKTFMSANRHAYWTE
ncbi:hypothetical protein D3C77_685940 [compost metagenome]